MQAQLPELKYNADGLIPCIVQDVETREVLMMAWMNAESLQLTLERGETVFWSRFSFCRNSCASRSYLVLCACTCLPAALFCP